MSAVVTDSYAAAKASLRDNVKTLIAVFGGVAGVVLAGTPFSGYGSLEPLSERWVLASLALVASLLLLGVAVRMLLLVVLRPDLTYPSMLIEPTSDPEIGAVQRAFERHKDELLPRGRDDEGSSPIESVADLVTAKSDAWREYEDAQENDAKREAFERFERLADALASVNHWSSFTRAQVRVSRGIDKVLRLGLAVIVAIAVFALAANPGKEKSSAPPIYVVTPQTQAASAVVADPLPTLQGVHFATAKADLTPEAVARIGVARDYLRTHANSGILIFANTDTVGSDAMNQALAARRAERVAQLLQSEGGVSPARIFVTPLAKKDLPTLTQPETESESNRSVEMILILLPIRRS